MALSNKERVGRVLDALRDGLGPFVVREFKKTYRPQKYVDEIGYVIVKGPRPDLPTDAWSDEAALVADLDVADCLKLMAYRWNEVFQDKLGRSGRSYANELLTARNEHAHAKDAYTNDEAYRVADTAARLLRMTSAGDEAAQAEDIGRELLRLRFEAAAKKSKKDSREARPAKITTQTGLKPWREIVEPHPDVASGRYLQAEFMADLSQVMAGNAEPEYQDPVEFFRRTYLTEGLLSMLATGVRRLTAQGGDPVVQLKTSFGGGKTHSMLALYHLTGPDFNMADFPGGERLAEEIGSVDLPEANRAVLVGTALNPSKPHEYPDATVNTLWGELAYQLGGVDGYQMVAEADQKGVSPGSDTLSELLFKFGPCLVIIDELVAYARNIYGVDGLVAGTFDSIMTFMQALTEAVNKSQESMMLVSLPESKIEVGGEAGQTVLDTLGHIVGRIESVWKPVTATESFEIVRRRLFASEVDHAARDAVLNAFSEMYRNSPGEFPSGVGERDYLDRMADAYPIHPELFDRLYEDWSTLERFQRTRGVLRLMAAVIHQLWSHGDQSLLVIPGNVPLNTAPVRNELLKYLPDAWAAVYDKDIDGPESLPLLIDGEVPNLGRYNAARRVARSIFIGSAPSVAEQSLRGLEEVRIRLACAQPGEPTAVFGDALRRMGNQLMYLYTDGSRYWYDSRPTVNRLARDRAQLYDVEEIYQETEKRLRKVPKSHEFAGFHVAPLDGSDIVDEPAARVVVLRPMHTHKRGNGNTEAMQAAYDFLESRGSGQRLYKNMLMFIAPDQNDSEALFQAIREYMAWRSIQDEEEGLNLDAQQRRQVGDSLATADETVDSRMREAYSWLLTPVQADPMGPIELQSNRISGDDNFYERAARKLRNDALLIYQWSPDNLRMELDNYIWNDESGWSVGVKQLWDYLAQYCYLPRLFDQEVLAQAVRDGASRLDPAFAYATGIDDQGYHTGLVFRTTGSIYFDAQSLIVHPDAVSLPPEVESPPDNGDVPEEGEESPVPAKLTTRYYGLAKIDPQRVNKNVGLIVEEVVERLTSLIGSEVEVTIEISAYRSEGFDDGTMRTISENSKTLKFDDFGFEEE